MKVLRVGLMIGFVVGCSACAARNDSLTTSDASPPPSGQLVTTTSELQVPTSSSAVTTPPTTTGLPTTTDMPALTDVKVYLLRDERLTIVHRLVPGPAVLRGALTELLAGPTDAERADGLVSEVPQGTELLDVDLAEGLATVDLTSDFESGGGPLSMMARVAQVVFTVTQFDNADRALLWTQGRPIDVPGDEGVVLDQPQSRLDVGRALSGSVIIDTPAYGAAVSSPFAVTGEGDVYEGQFPIEVWANGEQIGGIAPVTAGAWGTWATFEVTVTLDASAGPIELIAYDPGGCGTGPECPPVIKTVVPLTLTK